MSIEKLGHARWAEEQSNDPTCKATVLYIRPGRPVRFRTNILRTTSFYPASSHTEVLSLAMKSDPLEAPLTLHRVVYLLVRKAIFMETSVSDGTLSATHMSRRCILTFTNMTCFVYDQAFLLVDCTRSLRTLMDPWLHNV